MLLSEYVAHTVEHRARHGDRTLVLMENGSYMEIHETGEGELEGLSQVLNMTVTTRNSKRMLVFQRGCMCKNVRVLLDAGWKVAVVLTQQASCTGDREPRRAVEVISPATWPSSALNTANSGAGAGAGADPGPLMAIFVELPTRQKKIDRRGHVFPVLAAGWATMDLGTGRTAAGEPMARAFETHTVLDELHRAVMTHAPCEVRLILLGGDDDDGLDGHIAEHVGLGLCRTGLGPRTSLTREACYAKLAYQNATLRWAFPETGLLTPIEFAGLERLPFAVTALVGLVEFAYQHNETVLERIQRPLVFLDDISVDEREEQDDTDDFARPSSRDEDQDEEDARARPLVMAYNAMRQLDVVAGADPTAHDAGPHQQSRSGAGLVGLLDATQTAMGRRALQDRLLHPTRHARALERRYDAIDRARRGKLYERVRLHLAQVGDLERAFRRLALGRTLPAEMPRLCRSLRAAALALVAWQEPQTSAAVTTAEVMIAAIDASLDLDRLQEEGGGMARFATSNNSMCLNDPSPFRRDARPTLDVTRAAIDAQLAVVSGFARGLNRIANAHDASAHVRIVVQETSGGEDGQRLDVWLSVTPKRWAAIKNAMFGPEQRKLVGSFDIAAPSTSGHGGARLTHPDLDADFCDRLWTLHRRLAEDARAEFASFVTALVSLADDAGRTRTRDGMDALVVALERVDVACACALRADRYGYARPRLCSPFSPSSPSSWIRATKLRHPIIEQINDREPFVANDVSLGCDGTRGMLLYGVNAVGKSSTMKAVGLAVVMAQAGMFVAAEALELAPFSQILTRIGSRDDLPRGHSTFMVEMLELRAILARACGRSLVIGDELCAGTESTSAVAIVGAGIERLHALGAPFVFATHLHELTKLSCVRALMSAHQALRVCHLAVREVNGALELDRRLAPGQGRETYGLEVCRTLNLDDDFLRAADAIRREVMGVSRRLVDPAKVSAYNARVYTGGKPVPCVVCQRRPAVERHHAVEQATADEHGLVVRRGGRQRRQHEEQHEQEPSSGSTSGPSASSRASGPFHKHRVYNLAEVCAECHDRLHAEGVRLTRSVRLDGKGAAWQLAADGNTD